MSRQVSSWVTHVGCQCHMLRERRLFALSAARSTQVLTLFLYWNGFGQMVHFLSTGFPSSRAWEPDCQRLEDIHFKKADFTVWEFLQEIQFNNVCSFWQTLVMALFLLRNLSTFADAEFWKCNMSVYNGEPALAIKMWCSCSCWWCLLNWFSVV